MTRARMPERPIIVRGECVRFERYRLAPPQPHESRRRGDAQGRSRKRRGRAVAHRAEAAIATR